ncbi:3-oxoacyl-[acyl-carrier-protein] synthase III C-terminal domain-containing protein [Plantactinospora sp. KLBMP9567]|uniref:3-oxoacyl-[acyl-carrier-protein] synthase III C-terminal domain-containing protein n=1 Tax=Plantactinospora sp. KLBMP9567 TaxID=3085900 RepID=UPI00298145B1|nr:3-oxoacyl-[acyl-carrier-protein] synthase III C-terminal domain-containing protein [Plantactinospora sp. KLBMP9567]MDW5329529.1 3-oxoacyl-[acyl-carrier-protein] synthase III C-terminal domain-containing protein [Plantactinospora sp. KLBMP9567]
MTSLAAMAHYLPRTRLPVGTYLKSHGFTDAEIDIYRRYFGFDEVRFDADETWLDQAFAAAQRLTGLRAAEPRIRYLIQARTMPVATVAPANPLHRLRDMLGLRHAAAFCVNQHACASGLLAVSLAGKLLARDGDPDALALVFVGEKSFTATPDYIAQTGVMGEGVAAVLVQPSGQRDRMLGYANRMSGMSTLEDLKNGVGGERYRDIYADGLAAVIRGAVERAGLTVDDVDMILPHNANRLSWARVLKKLGIRGTDRLFLDTLPRLGHCFGADAFINYETARAQGRIRPGDHYVMTAVGLCATFSAMVFEH